MAKEKKLDTKPRELTEFEESMKARVIRGMKESEKGAEDWKKWTETLYEPDCLYYYDLSGKGMTNEEHRKSVEVLEDAFVLEQPKEFPMIAEGDILAVFYTTTLKGKPGKKYMGVDVTGKTIKTRAMEFCRFVSNPEPVGTRLKECWVVSDSLSMMAQLGVINVDGLQRPGT